jgi:hypothetical protein
VTRPILRAITFVYAAVFVAAALQNFGLRLADWYFSEPIWQAGAGEAVIGVVLLVAAFRARLRLYWIAYALSVLGIAFGLLSVRVVGAAREIHVILVPLAIVGVALVVWQTMRERGAVRTR